MSVVITGRTWTSFSDAELRRTSVSIDEMLFGLARAHFGSDEKVREYILIAMKSRPENSKSISDNLLAIVAKPSLLRAYKNEGEDLQTDIEDFC